MTELMEDQLQWEKECIEWRGKVLTGEFRHYCAEFDGLPVDDTCFIEISVCTCFSGPRFEHTKIKASQFRAQFDG